MSIPLEHDYIGLSVGFLSSMESSENSFNNFKETELRLGLPGSESPERKLGVGVSSTFSVGRVIMGDKNDYPLCVLKNFGSGSKRGFSDSINGSGKWVFFQGGSGSGGGGGSEFDLGNERPVLCSPRGWKSLGGLNNNCTQNSGSCSVNVVPPLPKLVQEKQPQISAGNNYSSAAKSQVVGWPPIRSFRKNTLATNPAKKSDDSGSKLCSGCLYVKVSMEGAPYLRKVDLKTYSNYVELLSALEKMFGCFTIGQCSSGEVPGRDVLSESRLMDLLHGSQHVVTYEDKDGDWMLVGDVPWEMFIDSCNRLRIMKGSEAIGFGLMASDHIHPSSVVLHVRIAPRAMEKYKNRN